MTYLGSHRRLDRPPLCPQSLYDLMLLCWAQLYHFRPTFTEVKEQLRIFQENQQQPQINSNQQPMNLNFSVQSYREKRHSDNSDSGHEHSDENQTDYEYVDAQFLSGRNTNLHPVGHQMRMVSNPIYSH